MNTPRKFPSRLDKSAKHTKGIPEVERALAHVGLFSRVARSIGRSQSHVHQVAKGDRQSQPVLDAIIEEVRRIDASTAIRRERAA